MVAPAPELRHLTSYFGFSHLRDPAIGRILSAWEALGLAAFGPVTDVDTALAAVWKFASARDRSRRTGRSPSRQRCCRSLYSTPERPARPCFTKCGPSFSVFDERCVRSICLGAEEVPCPFAGTLGTRANGAAIGGEKAVWFGGVHRMALFGAFGRRSRPRIPRAHADASPQPGERASRNPCREICRSSGTGLQGCCVERYRIEASRVACGDRFRAFPRRDAILAHQHSS